MFIDYTKQVLLDYERKKKSLPLHLSQPTPARLRDECLIVCKMRLRRIDEKALRDFFGVPGEHSNYLRLIEHCDINKFKPVINFIKNPTIKTDEKNVELLALLIDFQQRPYDDRIDYTVVGEETISTDTEQTDTEPINRDEVETIPVSPIEPQDKHSEKSVEIIAVSREEGERSKPYYKKMAVALAAGITSLTGLAVYTSGTNAGHCMYWNGDHYEQISCSEKIAGASLIALNADKLEHFKKITRPDTLTENDISWVWYIKIDGDIEFYTASGVHPKRNDRGLHPMTAHIFQKYILPLKSPIPQP